MSEAYMVEEIVIDNDPKTEMVVDKTAKEDDKRIGTSSPLVLNTWATVDRDI